MNNERDGFSVRTGPVKKWTICLLTAGAVLLAAPNANAACSGFGGIGLFIGAQSLVATPHVVAFSMPAMVVAARDGKVNYWPGFGYVAAGSSVAGLATLAITQIKCNFAVAIAPPLAGLGGGIVAGLIWGYIADDEPVRNYKPQSYSVTSLDVVPTADRRGAVLTVSGVF
ncbi:MAG TPA: hypothetical protein ENK23_05375 [Sorangium sp.]|nr:hypothetical protein [Sorangium sp.]